MPSPMSQTSKGKSSDSAPVLLVPFTRAADEHIESFFDQTLTLSGSTQAINPIDIPAYGYIRGIFVEVTASGGVGTAVYKGDGPFPVLQDVSVQDVNSQQLVGPVDGFDLYLINKFGGYRTLPRDPKLHPDYSASTAGGNFSFLLYIPLEVNARDGLGSLANMNAASAYKLRLSLAPNTTVFSTIPPTTQPNVRIRAYLDAWTQPTDVDLAGNPNATEPPVHGTTSFWSKTAFNVPAGQFPAKLPRVGNYIRNQILVFRDSSGVRDSTDFPAPITLSWDTRVLKEYQPKVWRGLMARRFNLTGTDEAAGALNTGVYVEDYCHEFDGAAGAELRDNWLPTTQSTRLEWVGNYGAAGTLTVLTNDVAPAVGKGSVFV